MKYIKLGGINMMESEKTTFESFFDWEKTMEKDKAYSALLKIIEKKISISGEEIKKIINFLGPNYISIIKIFYRQYMMDKENDIIKDDMYYYLIKTKDRLLIKRDKSKSPKNINRDDNTYEAD